MTRKFTHSTAVRSAVPLLIGLAGPSGGGKTYSALRLGRGIQRVDPGPLFVIDTEQRRALHYADQFDFEHVVFDAPFSPLDYLAAIEHCVRAGARTIIVDSFSHEHEGPGGVLEMHAAEVERIAAEWRIKHGKANFPAWNKPKSERRRMLNTMIQFPCNYILCFRAKEKAKPKDGDLVDVGWMPIGGEEILFEMTARALLPPNSDGVPMWRAERPGEKLVYKLPAQFREMFGRPHALCEDDGEAMARWAAGSAAAAELVFSKHLEWDGQKEWGGRPVTDASPSIVVLYGGAVEAAMGRARKPAKRQAMGAHLKELQAYLATVDLPASSDPALKERGPKELLDLAAEAAAHEEAMADE